MPTSFRPYQPDQSLLFPASPRDWLDEGHLSFFVSDTIDQLDLSAFYARYEGDGRRKQPFDPRMMVKILVYGYCTGVFSSRRIAKALREDVAFRYLAADNFPAFRTIADFRKRHLQEFRGLFQQVVVIARELELMQMGTVILDGSKIKANASKHKAMTYDRMKKEEKRLEREIRAIVDRAAEIDEAEDLEFGPDFRGDELPEELTRRESRLEKIKEAKKRLEERQAQEDREKGREPGDDDKKGKRGRKFQRQFGVPEDRKQSNFTDPDSRIMKDSKGFEQAYNVQIAVDEETLLIVENDVSQKGTDVLLLHPMVERIESTTGRMPTQLLADAGYRSEANLSRLEEAGIDAYIALGRESRLTSGIGGPATVRMQEKLRTPEGRKRYKRRKVIEAVLGWVKQAIGFRSFLLRGIDNVRGEWDLVCLAVNMRRLNRQIAWV